ncbi:YdcF family protein [Paucibacter sp. Y2R2-4]|uniref:YdcF family protein n=1 Tax=Paucibacter sp. Y2R2-4 TaxID=2893553 RepID=UPI0021E422AF|nr:YdcF family protein [Paucibacter sp. Y2R2-4]MCV2348471.1 YdcF family protein [Paucibacter sp. Y2R2-4]
MDFNSFLYALKPVLMTLIQPPLPFLGLMLFGAGQLRSRRNLGRVLLFTGFIAAYLSCTEGMGQLLAKYWIGTPAALNPPQLAMLKAESERDHKLAVLVLGGGIRQDVPEYAGPRPNEISQERLLFGIWLAKRLNAPLGYSGGIGWTAKRQIDTEAAVAGRIARDEHGMPLRWAEEQSKDTRENAALSLSMLKKDGIKTVVLVTQDMHMPRSMRAFQTKAGDEIRVIAAPVGQRRDAMSKWHDWVPSATGLARVNYAVYEWVANVAGH